MPKKPIRFGLKVWALADVVSKYMWDFEIYCGKGGNPHDNDGNDNALGSNFDIEVQSMPTRSGPGEGFSGRKVVKDFMKDLAGHGHIVTTDNYFTFVPLFLDLLKSGTMVTGTLRANRKMCRRVFLPKKITKKQDIGWMDYRMH